MISKQWNLAIIVLSLLVLFGIREYRNRPRFVFIPNDISVTIPEGTNIADIDRIVRLSGVTLTDRLLTPENLKLEGHLFPDTYRFDKNSSSLDIIERMKKTYTDKKTLIIASMLEKEVRTEEDMRIVAGIIKNRLDVGMALQIDATVSYGACLPQMQRGEYCDVSKVNIVDNIKRDSAYNTYSRVGLPAGPISNPGEKAIFAASNPMPTNYWYYLSKPDGTTVFSRTLEEHNIARAKYL